MIGLYGVVGLVVGWLLLPTSKAVIQLRATPPAPTVTLTRRMQWAFVVLSALAFASTPMGMMWLVLAFLLLVMLTDIQYRLIPDMLTLPAIALILVWGWFQPERDALWVGGGLALFVFLGTYLTSAGQLGGGDVKLAVFLGLLLGFPDILWSFFLGAISGTLLLLYLRRAHPKQAHIPYAPFLCVSAWLVLLQLG